MSNVNPDSKHDKDSEHETTVEKGKKRRHVTRSFNQKTIILVLFIILILLVASFLIFQSPNPRYNNDTKATENNTPIDDGGNAEDSDYKTINGTAISTNITETNIPEKVYRERIEVPGDIVDKIAQAELKNKNADNSQYNTGINKLEAKSQRTYVSRKEGNKPTVKITATKTKTEKTIKFNELPLRKVIENNHYTIQLSGSSTKKNLLKYVKEHKIENYQIYETKRKDDTWFVVVKGDYPTLSDAKSALNALPNKLKNDKPWIRKGKSIYKN